MPEEAILLMRLEGPLQAWGTSTRWRIRETHREPTFSGVTGMLCAALGWKRDADLGPFHGLQMGVRVEREGLLLRDYHTVGAGIGNLTAGGVIKYTQGTGEIEPLISERYYLADASFLVGLQGERQFLQTCLDALKAPIFPVYLGRKSCPMSVPAVRQSDSLHAGEDLETCLRAQPWQARLSGIDPPPSQLRLVLSTTPEDPRGEPRGDLPVSFARREFRLRYVRTDFAAREEVRDAEGKRIARFKRPRPRSGYVNYNSKGWRERAEDRLAFDNYRCVFTGLPAEMVHHITYRNANNEKREDLRSLSTLCHDAITMLEAERGLFNERIDPYPDDPRQRETLEYLELAREIREKIEEILANRRAPHIAQARFKLF